MILRLSQYIHLLPVGHNRVLIVDAISHVRLVVDDHLANFIRSFSLPKEVSPNGNASEVLAALINRGILTTKSSDEELQHVASILTPYHGRDPIALLDRFRLRSRDGVEPYFSITEARTEKNIVQPGHEISILIFGECDVQMESDFLRAEASRRGIALKIAAGFPHDLRLASEREHDAILVGALRER
jgi:hypothetical protein